ncbi:hypothetical protein BH24ACT13_BH24ACT13_14410 [soil metagenome]
MRRLPRRLRRQLSVVRFRVRVWVFRHKLGIAPLRNVLTDRKYGGWSGGSRTSTHADLGANLFGSVHYYELPRIFSARNGLEITPSDVLVDIGCGKGRVINWWLGLGLANRIIGLEIEELLAIEARKRLQRYPNVHIVAGDAIDSLPVDGTVFWLFNPFTVGTTGRTRMEQLSARLTELYGDGSSLRLVLYRPRHVEVFRDDSRWDVRLISGLGLFYDTAVVTPRPRPG